MRPSVTLVAAGVAGTNAVGSRISAFANGLDRRGWRVTVTMDTASAVESRVPAKIYDYLATGVPVIACQGLEPSPVVLLCPGLEQEDGC